MVEIDFQGTEPVRAGDQFGIGRDTAPMIDQTSQERR